MKNINIYLFTLFFVSLLFSGCGEGSNKTVFGDSPSSAITMVLNQEYQVTTGDKLIPDSKCQIVVLHELDNDTKTVKIVSGSAVLLKGDYASK
jgi:predicted component of type VI protein secretion system